MIALTKLIINVPAVFNKLGKLFSKPLMNLVSDCVPLSRIAGN